ILFDKTPEANWKVTWHQDVTIAVAARREVEGFGPWSMKAGVIHVQPSAEILEQMLAVRIHLDDCGPENGPVRVLPGSHRLGKLTTEEIATIRVAVNEQPCIASRGTALLMRPLIVHASSGATRPGHRRVIHIEYANCTLPGGLDWRW